MARMVLSGAGAVVGGIFGGQFGASVGWIAGSILGNILFPQEGQDITNEGPRLQDKTVSSSAYGTSISIAYGTLRVPGNIIWSSGIEEVKNTEQHTSGGKGGGSQSTQTVITYSYFASFAIAFAEGPADGILRLWADSKLIYDKTGTTEEELTKTEQIAGRAGPDIIWRFYPGD